MERSPDLEEFVRDWFAHATRGDAALVRSRVSASEHTRLIGSDPDEVFRGGAAVATFLCGEVDGAGGAVTFTPDDVEAFAEGSVGWATTHVTIRLPDGGQVSPRWSAVFHREDGTWMFVQTHASIAVANDAVGWVYPDRE
ncbi:MAG: nuclear transport factor 2 family protein [Pseudonocardia sp.]